MTGAIAHVAVVLPEVFYHFPLNFTYPFRICICSKHLLSAFWVFRQFVNPDWGSPPLQKMCLLISNCNASTPRKRGLHFFLSEFDCGCGGSCSRIRSRARNSNICSSAFFAEFFFVLLVFIKCTSAGSYFLCSTSENTFFYHVYPSSDFTHLEHFGRLIGLLY